jgi:hypothetical protein
MFCAGPEDDRTDFITGGGWFSGKIEFVKDPGMWRDESFRGLPIRRGRLDAPQGGPFLIPLPQLPYGEQAKKD